MLDLTVLFFSPFLRSFSAADNDMFEPPTRFVWELRMKRLITAVRKGGGAQTAVVGEASYRRRTLINVDERAIGALQWVYDQMLDRLDTRIGTFRMATALTPVAAETTARIFRGTALFNLLPDLLFLLGISIFYTFRMMKCDDQLQTRCKFRVINMCSLRFRSKHIVLRLFYLFFFTSSLLFHHNVGGLSMMVVVYARCLTVRERRSPMKRQRLSCFTPSAG